ncbi:hypothetical protein [Aneurinibacillus aneurinilyticus]|uniref:hypothetical protein n=1 Tax=Aneurinibacillus aneurinilyticus TaxID=1391 RepID=UPI003524B598
MKMHVVYISRLMKASEVRKVCAATSLLPDTKLINTIPKKKEKAAECGNTLTA